MNKDFLAPQSSTATGEATPLIGSAVCDFGLFTLPQAFVSSLLPERLELAPHPFGDLGDKHPVCMMYNDTHLQSNVFLEKLALENDLELKLHYDEFIVLFPYVQFKDKPSNSIQGPFIYLPVLYLNSPIAVAGGRVFYEFNKLLVEFDKTPETIQVSTLLFEQSILQATFAETGQNGIAESFPNFVSMSPLLQLPVVEHGPYGYVSSVYHIAYQNVEIQPSTIVLENHSSPCLPVSSIQIPDISTSVFGAFKFTYEWTLSYPRYIITW